jgi:hypothetical protein
LHDRTGRRVAGRDAEPRDGVLVIASLEVALRVAVRRRHVAEDDLDDLGRFEARLLVVLAHEDHALEAVLLDAPRHRDDLTGASVDAEDLIRARCLRQRGSRRRKDRQSERQRRPGRSERGATGRGTISLVRGAQRRGGPDE